MTQERERAKRLSRLVAIQRHMEQAAAAELQTLASESAAVKIRIEDLTVALGRPDAVGSVFARFYGTQVARLSVKDRLLTGRVALQEKRFRTERSKANRLEERHRLACDEATRLDDDENVLDLLDLLNALR